MFYFSLNQVMTWIYEKTQIATDESYRDPVNLQSKIMKHQTFEAELIANKRRVDAVIAVRDQQLQRMHSRSVMSLISIPDM